MSEVTKSVASRIFSGAKAIIKQHVLMRENAMLAIVLLALIGFFAAITGGNSFSGLNARNLLFATAVPGIAAIGQTFVILTGGIDLSVGGIALLCSLIGATLMTGTTGFPVMAIVVMVLLGIGIGAINGVLVSRVRMPALIVTLAMWQILKGSAWGVNGGIQILGLPRDIAFLGQGHIVGVPVPSIIFAGVAAISYIVLYHTSFGRSVYATGGNPVSAWLSGIKVKEILLWTYVISGLCAAIASVIITSRIMVGSMAAGSSLELDSIAIVVIGGISLAGGRGNLVGVIIGAFIMSIINNGLNLMAVHPAYQSVIKGAIIMVAVAADYLRRERQ